MDSAVSNVYAETRQCMADEARIFRKIGREIWG
jgi:hypothetical protein